MENRNMAVKCGDKYLTLTIIFPISKLSFQLLEVLQVQFEYAFKTETA